MCCPLTGSNRRRDHKNVRIKKPDYKVAYVQLVSKSSPVPAPCHSWVLGLCVQYPPPFWDLDLETWGGRSRGPSTPPRSSGSPFLLLC